MSWGWILATALAFYTIGYVNAHSEVARECHRLGRFYVGKTVFHCTAIEERK